MAIDPILYNEPNLLKQVAEGNEEAFRLVFDHYRKKVFYIGWKLLKDEIKAEDILQEVFIKVWVNRVKLTDISNFKAWLNTITRNEVYSAFRTTANEENFLKEIATEQARAESTVLDTLALKELQYALQVAMTGLTPQQKKVFELSRLHGMKHEEIASQLNLTKETVKKHMTNALQIIRKDLGSHNRAVQFGILLLVSTI